MNGETMQTPSGGQQPDDQPSGLGDMPDSPLSAIGVGAAQLHELYLGFVEGGFTPAQALHILTAFFVETMRQNGGGGS